jgi:hypothetical protein
VQKISCRYVLVSGFWNERYFNLTYLIFTTLNYSLYRDTGGAHLNSMSFSREFVCNNKTLGTRTSTTALTTCFEGLLDNPANKLRDFPDYEDEPRITMSAFGRLDKC